MVNGVLRSVIKLAAVAAALLVYLTVASQAPWPVEGAAGFVWGAGLVAVAIGYAVKSEADLSRTRIAWGLIFAIAGFAFPLVLNQLLNSDVLYRFHKLLGFMTACIVFVVWINTLKFRTHRRSTMGEMVRLRTVVPQVGMSAGPPH